MCQYKLSLLMMVLNFALNKYLFPGKTQLYFLRQLTSEEGCDFSDVCGINRLNLPLLYCL